ncbi:DNA-binding Lrp family transcriptional regulator [Acinetobacter calcoaceticus]|uniref:DNA-binding Lrp family transcriptional regulator n=1 Tax=Acinetobacter calcoaceticus TaxID=471 RepID=A0A4R1XTQ8_ACICA|nr:DNA-binding Lrp family transcriptional regulator [Acinetobacter calcoaceticus]
MNVFKHIDEIDKACALALLENPRGSWRELSLACKIPEKKLARRINSLLENQDICIVAELNPVMANQGITVHVWIEVVSGKADHLAESLVQLAEVRVLFLTTGQADLFVEVGLSKSTDISNWVNHHVRCNADIKSVRTQVMLKPFTWAQHCKNKSDQSHLNSPQRQLSAEERQLIDLLSVDARLSIKYLSEQLQLSEHRTQKMLSDLQAEGAYAIRMYLDPSLVGLNTECVVQINVQPQHAEQIALHLANLPHTRCLFGMNGESQIFWHVVCQDLSDLWQLTTEELGQLEGVISCNSNMVIGAYKRAGFMRKGLKLHFDQLI